MVLSQLNAYIVYMEFNKFHAEEGNVDCLHNKPLGMAKNFRMKVLSL